MIGHAAAAQRADSGRVAVFPKRADTTSQAIPQPPLSPRRAFVYSFLAPGLGQSRLGRPTAGALFVLTEAIAIAMLRESAADLSQAQRFRMADTVSLGNDPVTGNPILQKTSFNDDLVKIRRGHVEDWIAFLVANHLFAGADAYVAAHLWDLPSQIAVKQEKSGTAVAVRFRW